MAIGSRVPPALQRIIDAHLIAVDHVLVEQGLSAPERGRRADLIEREILDRLEARLALAQARQAAPRPYRTPAPAGTAPRPSAPLLAPGAADALRQVIAEMPPPDVYRTPLAAELARTAGVADAQDGTFVIAPGAGALLHAEARLSRHALLALALAALAAGFWTVYVTQHVRVSGSGRAWIFPDNLRALIDFVLAMTVSYVATRTGQRADRAILRAPDELRGRPIAIVAALTYPILAIDLFIFYAWLVMLRVIWAFSMEQVSFERGVRIVRNALVVDRSIIFFLRETWGIFIMLTLLVSAFVNVFVVRYYLGRAAGPKEKAPEPMEAPEP